MKKRKWGMTLILIMLILGVFLFIEVRYHAYNKYNIYAERAIKKLLDYRYDETFHLVSVDFVAKEKKVGDELYIHIWTYTFEDTSERIFCAYLWGYGLTKNGGNFHEPDYSTYRSETYGQIRLEECIPKEYELYKYRQNKDNENLDVDDYLFICKDENKAYIAEILTQIFFKEATFSPNGCLRCLVEDENGEELYVYWSNTIKGDLKKKGAEITEEAVQEYILEQLEK